MVFKINDLNFGAGPIDRVLWPAKDLTRMDVQVHKQEHTR